MKPHSHDKHREVLLQINSLPKKIVSIHGLDNVTEFVLHELCGQGCFDLNKAAFIVDNAEFNCLKGIAGYSRHGSFEEKNHWNSPEQFSKHMSDHDFNKKVREVNRPCAGGCDMSQESMHDLAKSLGIEKPAFHVFKLKHGNCGLFIYELPEQDDHCCYMNDALYLFSFCPIF